MNRMQFPPVAIKGELFKWIGKQFGELVSNVLWGGIILCIFIYRAPYRKWGFYKRIMGDKAKPYPYDGNGKRVYRWNGTTIEKPEEDAEPGTLEGSEAADGEQEEETK